jgi:hypothetical protein
MKQRVCIAIGVCLKPDLIIADEPTSALDVITQRHVMQTLREVQEDRRGPDPDRPRHGADGAIGRRPRGAEAGRAGGIRPREADPRRPAKHPYTKELISSVPLVGGESFIEPAAAAPKGFTTEDGTPLLELRGGQKIWRGHGAASDELQARRGGAQDHLHRGPIGVGQVHDGQPDAGLQPALDGAGPVQGAGHQPHRGAGSG